MPTHEDEIPKIAFLHNWRGNDAGQKMYQKPNPPAATVGQLHRIQSELGLTVQEMARIMDLSESTLLRRYREKGALLTPHQSDILAHLQQVIREGLAVYETMPLLNRWLGSALPALGNQLPKDLLWTIQGRSQLLEVFNQLKHGYTF